MARTFNKAALTKGFQQKVKIAQAIFNKWDYVGERKNGPYEKSGTFIDRERNIYLRIYIGTKTIGVGAGRVNECNISFSYQHHPELNAQALTRGDLKPYLKLIS